ncbi:PAS domain-containing protein [Desulfobotulus mexicanus]|uniref:PAS domain-containing protein n=2 Tax=Desulfobotulus mexicanus TaxID=2586642 RepID=A0A5S5MBS7_9BACT|nr:PAS domain-containing protein [Desulfobotulus mexicanus]
MFYFKSFPINGPPNALKRILSMQENQREEWRDRVEKAETDALFYRMIFEKSTAPTIVIESDYTISRINERVEELLGYSKEEIEGKIEWLRFVVREDLERMMRYHHTRRKDPGAAPGEYECRLMNREGQVHDILIKLDMIRGTTTSVATLVNVTAEKAVVKTLRQREAEFRAIVEHFTGFLYTLGVTQLPQKSKLGAPYIS